MSTTNGAVREPAELRAEFSRTYEKVMRKWPGPSETANLTSQFGTTRVYVSGPVDAPALLMFHAYQATSAEWIALAGELNGEMRLYAVDVIGDAGGSTVGDQPIGTPEDMVAWIDTVLDGLGLSTAELCGHSYGAWIALAYAIARPGRVDRLTLLDPTMTFAPLLPRYILRALPALLKPTSVRRRSLIRWESRKAIIDPDWLDLTAQAAEAFGDAPTVPTKIPKAQVLSSLTMPVLVLVAARSRVHLPRRVVRSAGRRLPDGRVESVADATHYGLPLTHPAEIAALMRGTT